MKLKLNVKIILFTIIIVFINITAAKAGIYGQPVAPSFNIPLQAGSATFDMAGAKAIANALFYIALCLGLINIIRTMVFHPEHVKKVIINWCAGIIAFSILINIFG